MTSIIVSREIDAPKDLVFQTVADIRNFAKACPKIVDYEFLSDTQTGIGTRFRETREMQGKQAVTELEVTEYVENEHIRLEANSHGTIWDSLFSVSEHAGVTTLTLTMHAHAYKLLARVLNFLIQGMIKKEVAKDLEQVKTYCEQLASSA